jgi:hypothetical protein
MNRTGRTVGAGIGALIFVLFFAELAARFVNPVSAAEPAVTISAR